MAAQEDRKKIKQSTVLVNGGTTPLVYDEEGRVLAAGGRVEVDEVSDVARHAVSLGFLSIEEPEAKKDPAQPKSDPDPSKKAATGPGESAQA